MLILHVTYKLDPDKRDDFIKALLDGKVRELTEAEDGNIQYCFAVPIDADDEMVITEMWESQEALEAHFAGAPIQRLKEIKAMYGVETVKMNKYQV